jgi:lipopolysaccharide export system protein LptC
MITAFLLVIAVSLTSWSLFLSRQKHAGPGPLPGEPDAFMEQVVAIILDRTGAPHLEISSPKMVHFVLNDTTDISNPSVIIYRDSPNPWYVKAKKALATGGTGKIIFSDHVVIRHPADTAATETILNTETLTVLPKEKQAKTDDAVTITQPDTTLYGVGMLANLETGTIRLLSNTRSEYVPAS